MKHLDELRTLHAYPSITITMPTHRSMPDKMQDRIRLKNLVKHAEERLLQEFSQRDVESILQRLHALADSIDLTHTKDGLVLLVNNNISQHIILSFPVDEAVIIDDKFATRDLAYAQQRTPRYWVLALSQNASRLLHASGKYLYEITETRVDDKGIPITGFPLNALPPEDREREAYGEGDRGAHYLNERKKNFFRLVDEYLGKELTQENLPVILLGDKDDRALFTEVTTHKNALVAHHQGNFDRADVFALEKIVWPLIEEYQQRKRDAIKQEFDEAVGALKTTHGFQETWRAAQEGRIHCLLIEQDFHVPGTIDEHDIRRIIAYSDPHFPGISDDLTTHLIDVVTQKGGDVIFFDPNKLSDIEHVGAILRF